MLLLAMSVSAFGFAGRNETVSIEKFGEVEEEVKRFEGKVKSKQEEFDGLAGRHKAAGEKEVNLLSPLKNRNKWMELLKSINECLPRDVGAQKDNTELSKKKMVKISAITAERVEDVGKWFNELDDNHKIYMREDETKTGAPPPQGPGYIITLDGLHYHHDEKKSGMRKVLFVKNAFLNNLQEWVYAPPRSSREVDVRKLGISHATIVASKSRDDRHWLNGKGPAGAIGVGGQPGGIGGLGTGVNPGETRGARGILRLRIGLDDADDDDKKKEFEDIIKTTFKIQFLWQPIPFQDREKVPPVAALNKE